MRHIPQFASINAAGKGESNPLHCWRHLYLPRIGMDTLLSSLRAWRPVTGVRWIDSGRGIRSPSSSAQ